MSFPLPTHASVGTDGEELDRILASRDVHSLFQPIVDLGSTEPLAYEALSRGPADSPLHRADLLFAAARAAGRVDDLDELCRGRAFEAMVDSSLQAPYVLFVNREPSTVSGSALTPQHLTILRRRGLRVVMELTERDLSHHPAELLAFADRIRAAGMGIALDDVGVDADSLALMPFLMPDVIKLDMGLLRTRPDTAGVQVVSAVRAHAERRGTVILAEGIETEEQERLAVAMGATLGQGWRYGRPAPLPSAEQLRAARIRTLPSRPVVLRDPDPELAAASPFEMATRTIPPIRGPLDLLAALRLQMEHEVEATNGLAVVLTTCVDPPDLSPASAENYVQLARAARFAAVLGRDMPDEIVPGLRGSPVPAEDPVSAEWNLVVVSPHSAVGLVARERPDPHPDEGRAFDYVLTYDRPLVVDMARALMMRALPMPAPEVAPPAAVDAAFIEDLLTMPADPAGVTG